MSDPKKNCCPACPIVKTAGCYLGTPSPLPLPAEVRQDLLEATSNVVIDRLRAVDRLEARITAQAREIERLEEGIDLQDIEKAWRFLASHSIECHWERTADDPRGQVVFPIERMPDVAEAILAASLEAVRGKIGKVE